MPQTTKLWKLEITMSDQKPRLDYHTPKRRRRWGWIIALTVILWIYSIRNCAWMAVRSPHRAFTILTASGSVLLVTSDAAADPGLGGRAVGWRADGGVCEPALLSGPDSFFASIGLVKTDVRIPWDIGNRGPAVKASSIKAYSRVIKVPYWLLALCVLTIAYFRRRRRDSDAEGRDENAEKTDA